MTLIVQQPYNMFRPGQVQGETQEQFAAGKQAANSQTGAVSQPVVEQKPAPVVQQSQVQKQQTQPVLDSNSSSAGMDYLNSLYTSPQEEERLRKASVMNQRILAIGDAIRHIGNIANTINYAPAQQLNSPVAEEQARYEKGKALRDRANQQFYTYQQQKAAQDAAQRKWEQQFQINAANAASQHAYRQEQARIAAERAANQKAYQEGNLARQTKADEARNKYNEAKLKQDKWYKGASLGIQNRRLADQQRRTTAYVNKVNSGGGSGGVAPLDTPKGQITPNGRNYSNQLLQMWGYANQQNLLQETPEMQRLRAMGFAKEADNLKRQQVMDLLRTNQSLADYASSRLGWSYGSGIGGGMDLGLEDDDEDEMDLGLD